ncbi:hypothetical protein [EBPR podovirus 2]|nr:hypothetical protein [EBPR podovirus 2]
MTRAEIRIAAAKKRATAAEAKWSDALAAKREATWRIKAAHNQRIWPLRRKMDEAYMAVAVAELAAMGINPMKTIILWHPRGYTAPSAQNRYVVRVTREGWKLLVPVGKTGVILRNRNDQSGPSRWDKVTVTDQEVQP